MSPANRSGFAVTHARCLQTEAAYKANAKNMNIPIRTTVPVTVTAKKNLAIPANAGMARFVRYVGGCRPGVGDDF